MCSIRDLLDEAEELQPAPTLPRPHTTGKIALAGHDDFHLSRTKDKIALVTSEAEWTGANLQRLEEILQDLTFSIDTLCDLSRPRVEGIEKSSKESPIAAKRISTDVPQVPRTTGPASVSSKKDRRSVRHDSPARRDDLTDMVYIDPNLIQQRDLRRRRGLPPSYESIASESENRLIAYLSLSPRARQDTSSSSPPPETRVLLDYKQYAPRLESGAIRPDSARVEELLLGLLKFSAFGTNIYTGVLKLTGWTVDVPKSRCAFVYEIPNLVNDDGIRIEEPQTRSLLSFLQYSGDADSNNMPSLENRFRLALNVALSILHVHETNLKHQNLNSNNIMFFVDQHSPSDKIWKGPVIRKPYLTGFHQRTPGLAGDSSFSGIYFHPELSEPSTSYEFAHDLYSLGLILLEIGLWMPLGRFWKPKYTLKDFKSRLQDVYLKKLSAKCGDGYMKAVQFCLTAADKGNDTRPGGGSTAETRTVRALYDYKSEQDTNLSFRQGDIIHVLTRLESGWFDGMIDRRRGWFPGNYCAPIILPGFSPSGGSSSRINAGDSSAGEDPFLGTMPIGSPPVHRDSPNSDEVKSANFESSVIRALERCCSLEADLDSIVPQIVPTTPQVEHASPEIQPNFSRSASSPVTNDQSISNPLPEQSTKSQTAVVKTNESKEPAQINTKIKVWSHELPALYSKYWTSDMFPKLERILRKAISRWESYTIDLFMAGEDADTARPTVFMQCTSTAKVRRILRHLNKDLRLFEIKVVPGQILRSKCAKKKRKNHRAASKKATVTSESASGAMADLNPHYQEKPACGASIGAYMHGNHLPPVTFGGALLVDGEQYGMSVHHMLEDEEEIQEALGDTVDLHRSMAPRKSTADDFAALEDRFARLYPFEMSELVEVEDSSSVAYTDSGYRSRGVSSTESLYPFEISDDDLEIQEDGLEDGDDFWLNPDFDTQSMSEDEDDDCDLGDTDGIPPGEGTSYVVTQPALDDVSVGYFPTLEDTDSEHLSSHTLGHIYATSGLRRSRSESLIHEIDWALIKIHPTRLPTSPNTPAVAQPSHKAPTHILPSSILASRHVHSHARSSGFFARGIILPSMSIVRMPGRISPSHSWQVRGSFGGGGDSGAWVFDDATGAVCGHVLAFSDRSGMAYIAPMEVMVRDIERVLGSKVGLPGGSPTVVEAVLWEAEKRETEKEKLEKEQADALLANLGMVRAPSPPFPTGPPAYGKHEIQRKPVAPGLRAVC